MTLIQVQFWVKEIQSESDDHYNGDHVPFGHIPNGIYSETLDVSVIGHLQVWIGVFESMSKLSSERGFSFERLGEI